MTPAALYIADNSIYKMLLPPECCWDKDRDATQYPGVAPVIAHPPCADYSRLSHLHTRQEPRAALARIAIAQVRKWGGVLEHPAQSRLWGECYLPPPSALGIGDDLGGWTLEVDQFDFGHISRKRTWLYVVGVDRGDMPTLPPRDKVREPLSLWQTHKTGSEKYKEWLRQMAKIGRANSRNLRIATPPAFAKYLIEIARRVKCKHDGKA